MTSGENIADAQASREFFSLCQFDNGDLENGPKKKKKVVGKV